MSSDRPGSSQDDPRGNGRHNLDPINTSVAPPTTLQVMQKAFKAPFSRKTKILSDLIMTPRMMNATYAASSKPRESLSHPSVSRSRMDFATLGRAPLKLGMGSRRLTSRDLEIVEATEQLLNVEVPEPDGVASNVSLLRGFNATVPSAEQSKSRRRQMRSLLMEEEDHEGQSVASEDDVVLVPRSDATLRKGKKRGRESLSATKLLGKDELTRQRKEILRDKENIHVKRSLVNNEIMEITNKIAALDDIRAKLEQDLIKLQEDELELDDELEGVKERLEFEQSSSNRVPQSSSNRIPQSFQIPHSSRRRKGPAFLPSEHDELPPGVAFMTLDSHAAPITALDFSEPYGTLVSASSEDSQPIVWDLFSGTELGRLRGHTGVVKCIQVEDTVCVTGSEDSSVRLWDLRRVDMDVSDGWGDEGEMVNLSDVTEEDEGDDVNTKSNGIRNGKEQEQKEDAACLRVLEGHTKAVTTLFFEDNCLVTGASDKTLRQWDLGTGQCVMTMDILWAIAHPSQSLTSSIPNNLFAGTAASVGNFAVPMPPRADGSWDMYEDFVGGVQFWGYGLVSGSGDGGVRMWDMRTGQAHRTLLGHTAPVTCLQFDEIHIASGSLDKTIRIWDVRTGGVFETLKYDHPVTALQFDTRKVIAATGENGVKIYNRTSMQHSTLLTNGHMSPVESLRYMDRYLVTGGRDSTVKVWSL
ncbi:WD40-repeat-containing domain protein [Rhodocollybia butyracea]|uniref:WD40-repeat-containing domain protein n=1 Tax=Rhodocollybia butyracea TaxID=206335 RepID=A0A9P5Q254_9AGAR|nr:WD40-repeat-containing domain protein [Rhodocollybia butyracea]